MCPKQNRLTDDAFGMKTKFNLVSKRCQIRGLPAGDKSLYLSKNSLFRDSRTASCYTQKTKRRKIEEIINLESRVAVIMVVANGYDNCDLIGQLYGHFNRLRRESRQLNMLAAAKQRLKAACLQAKQWGPRSVSLLLESRAAHRLFDFQELLKKKSASLGAALCREFIHERHELTSMKECSSTRCWNGIRTRSIPSFEPYKVSPSD